MYIHSNTCLLWDCMFKFISTCAYPNCVRVPNSWNLFSLLFWWGFFPFLKLQAGTIFKTESDTIQSSWLQIWPNPEMGSAEFQSPPLCKAQAGRCGGSHQPCKKPIWPRIAPKHRVLYFLFFLPHLLRNTFFLHHGKRHKLPSVHSTWRREHV